MELTDITMFPPPSRSSWFDRIVEWHFGHLVTVPPKSQYLAGQGQVSPEVCICSESVPNMWWYFSHRQDSQVLESNRVETRVASLTITPDDRLADISPCNCNLILCWSRGLSSKGRNASSRRHSNDPTELEVKTAIWLFWISHTSELIDKEGFMMLAEVTDPDYQLEIGLKLHNAGKEDYV